MITDILLGLLLVVILLSTAWLVSCLDELGEDIAGVERLVRRVADELDIDMDEDI